MKKYFVITGIASIICIFISIVLIRTVEFLSYGSAKLPLLAYAIVIFIPVGFLVYALALKRLLGKTFNKIVAIILFIISIPVYLYLLSGVVFLSANIYTEPFREEEIIIELGTKLEEENFFKLTELLKSFNNQLSERKGANICDKISSWDYNDQDVIEALEITKSERDELIEFLSNNKFAVPKYDIPESLGIEEYLEIDRSLLDRPEVDAKTVIEVFRYNLVEIKSMIESDRYDEGIKRYMSLWEALDNIFETKNVQIIDPMIMTSILENLINFYLENQDQISIDRIRSLSNILSDMENKIDDIYIVGVFNEYLFAKKIFQIVNNKNIWPLFDYKRTVNKAYDYYSYEIAFFREPYYKFDKIPEEMDSYSETHKKMLKGMTFKDYIVNPIGNILIEIIVSTFGVIAEGKEIRKSKIIAFNYILNKDMDIDIPIDNLTGKKLMVKEYDDYYKVNTEHMNREEYTYVYKISKKNIH